jgi:hypothetical protein
MKKIISAIVIVTVVALFSSCEKGFLETVPPNNVTGESFYRNQADIKKAVDVVYAGLQPWDVDIYFYMSEVRSNNFTVVFSDAQRDWSDISKFVAGPQTLAFRNVWKNGYQIVNRANEVLARIDGVTFTDENLKKQYKAELRFLRAFSYFQLVRLFNRVPLVDHVITPDEGIQIKQSEPADVYAFITSEMSAVMNDLPPSYDAANLGRATKWAVKGILANVYMTMAGYPLNQKAKMTDAKPLLEEIMAQEGGAVKFHNNYKEMFTYVNDNKFFIFEVQYISGGLGAGNSLPAQVYSEVSTTIATNRALIESTRLSITDDLINSYDKEDLRFNATIDTNYLTNAVPAAYGNTPYFSKFMDPGLVLIDRYDWPINFPLLRYEDVMLMYAEILNEQAGTPPPQAVALINRIRNRAGLQNINPATKADFNLAMLNERRKEFAFEGQYWFYLVRTGQAVKVMNDYFTATEQTIRIDEHDLIYAIPETEMNIFPGLYTQNPGY